MGFSNRGGCAPMWVPTCRKGVDGKSLYLPCNVAVNLKML